LAFRKSCTRYVCNLITRVYICPKRLLINYITLGLSYLNNL
jgi:hypothetical protein